MSQFGKLISGCNELQELGLTWKGKGLGLGAGSLVVAYKEEKAIKGEKPQYNYVVDYTYIYKYSSRK